MSLEIPITDRCRKYGYLYWTSAFDEAVAKLFRGAEAVQVVFDQYFIGEKNVDYKFRRVSLGWKKTRELPASVKMFRLSMKEGKLRIECR